MAAAAKDQVELAREHRAEQERKRRARKAALKKAGLEESMDKNLTDEQKERAERAAEEKAGLSGNALAAWITEGKDGKTQVEEAQASSQAEKAETRTRANITRSADPEAAQLAKDAAALAPEVRSAFLPKDAREFLDLMTIEVIGDAKVKVARSGAEVPEGALDEIELTVHALREFGIKGEKDKETRAKLAGIGKGSRLWGRKLALMILARRLDLRKTS